MNKRYYVLALVICLVLLVSACKQGGAATGGAPKTPFIGGTTGLTINFEGGSPPPEVTDDSTFEFDTLVRLKNDGESKVTRDNVKVNLVGFDPSDFNVGSFDSLSGASPEDDLEPKTRGAEGDIQDGFTVIVTFPKGGGFFTPQKFIGNTEFTFRADVCYHYTTRSQTAVCLLRDMINVNDKSFCRPTGSKTIYSSAAPVQVTNFRQSVVGPNKITFNFDIVLNGNVDIFWSQSENTPSSGFDAACPRKPSDRRGVENKVGVEIIELPGDPIVSSFKCGGLDNGPIGVVTLINGKRNVICTVELVQDRNDLEKQIGINLKYNVLDNKETSVLVKHLATD